MGWGGEGNKAQSTRAQREEVSLMTHLYVKNEIKYVVLLLLLQRMERGERRIFAMGLQTNQRMHAAHPPPNSTTRQVVQQRPTMY